MRSPNRTVIPNRSSELLRARLSALWNVPGPNILLGRGSDEGIDLLIRMFCRAGEDQILICPPTYGEYKVLATIQGAETLRVPLTKEWQLDVPAILKASTPKTKLIFIPTPNAPMGHMMKREDILSICKGRAEQSLVVVDEAYIEFTETPDGLISELANYPNLVILRTLSKAYGLAGERIGGVIGAAELINELLKILAPYALSQSGTKVALDAPQPQWIDGKYRAPAGFLISERERMRKIAAAIALGDGRFPERGQFSFG